MVARLLCLLLLAHAAGAAEVTRAGRWELHNSFWMNLHQTLMHDATARAPREMSGWSAEEGTAWSAAVTAYREARGNGSITFAQPMRALQSELTQVADDAVSPHISGPLGDAILRAAPVYRARWWRSDEAANRFLLGYTAAMLRDAGEELARAHETVYGKAFPDSIRVDITAYAEPFGAYSHPLEHGFVVTMSSRDSGNHGLTALEIVLHESSHSVVSPYEGRVNAAIQAAAGKAGVKPGDLWHAILFATTSELTRRALVQRGASAYVPMSQDLLTRAWPEYREPIEKFWIPYLSGSGTLEDAIAKVVGAVPH